MPTKYDKMSPKSVRSTLSTGGSLDSNSLLPLQKSLAADVNELARVLNNLYDVVYSFNGTTGGLIRTTDTRFDSQPDFTGSVGVKPADIGIEGRNIYVYTANNDTVYSSPDFDALDPLFWYQDNQGDRRPNTIYETFQEFKTYVDSEIENIQITTAAVAAENCITSCSYTKSFIGTVAFDSTASALGEIDSLTDKVNKALFRIDQLEIDSYEPSYSFNDHRLGSPAAGVRSCTLEEKIDAVMLLHGVASACDTGGITHAGLVDNWTDGTTHLYPASGATKSVVVGSTLLGGNYNADQSAITWAFEVDGPFSLIGDQESWIATRDVGAGSGNSAGLYIATGTGGNNPAGDGGAAGPLWVYGGPGGTGSGGQTGGVGGGATFSGGTGGTGGAADGDGGVATFQGGASPTAGDGDGGHAYFAGGVAGGLATGIGGNAYLRGGNAPVGGSGTYGSVVIGDVLTDTIVAGKAAATNSKFFEVDGSFYMDFADGDSSISATKAADEIDGSNLDLIAGDGGTTIGTGAGGDGGSITFGAGYAYGGSSVTQGGQAAGIGGDLIFYGGDGGWGSFLAAVTATIGKRGGNLSFDGGDGGDGGISTGDGGQAAGIGGGLTFAAGAGGGTYDSVVAAVGGALGFTGGKGGDGLDGTSYPWGVGGAANGIGADGGPVVIAGGAGGASQTIFAANGGAATLIGGGGGYLSGVPREVQTPPDVAPLVALDGGDGGPANVIGGTASWHNSFAASLPGLGGDASLIGGEAKGNYAGQIEAYGGDVFVTGGSVLADTLGSITSIGGTGGDVTINGGLGDTINGTVYIGNIGTPQIVLGNARVTCNGPLEIAAQDSAVSTQYRTLSWGPSAPTIGFLWADPDVNFIEIETWPAADPVLGSSVLVLPTAALLKTGHIYIIKIYDDVGSGILYPEANLFGPGITESFDGPGRYTDNNLMEISGAGTYEFISNGSYWVIRNLYIIGTYS